MGQFENIKNQKQLESQYFVKPDQILERYKKIISSNMDK